MKIDYELLSTDSLNGLIDEFVSRDSVVWDGSAEEKRARVHKFLETGKAVILFSEEDSTTHILTADEYAKLEAK